MRECACSAEWVTCVDAVVDCFDCTRQIIIVIGKIVVTASNSNSTS